MRVDGELQALDRAGAERLTERIRVTGRSVADGLDSLSGLIAQAQAGEAHAAMGYRSWTAYVAAEFADLLPRLDRATRREVVAQLSDAGMSTRAIAPVVGTSHVQVGRDLSGVTNVPPEPTHDGPEVVDAEIVRDEPEPRRVTGMDGRSYPRRGSARLRAPDITQDDDQIGKFYDPDTGEEVTASEFMRRRDGETKPLNFNWDASLKGQLESFANGIEHVHKYFPQMSEEGKRAALVPAKAARELLTQLIEEHAQTGAQGL